MNTLPLLPSNSLIGIITYGKMVELHRLDLQQEITSTFCLRGTKTVTAEEIEVGLSICEN